VNTVFAASLDGKRRQVRVMMMTLLERFLDRLDGRELKDNVLIMRSVSQPVRAS
jgi:hypothetical protein